MCDRDIIIRGCIVVHTLCSRYLLVYSRIYVHAMLGRDLCLYGWIDCVHGVSEGIIISSRRVFMHTLCQRVILP